MFSRLSVRVLVPLMLAIPVAVVAAVIGSIAVSAGQRTVNDLAGRLIDQLAIRIEQRVEEQLELAMIANRSLLVLIEAGVLDPDDLRAWREPLWDQMKAFEGISAMTWGDARSGDAVWMAKYSDDSFYEFAIKDARTEGMLEQWDLMEDGRLGDALKSASEYALVERPWYAAGAAGGTISEHDGRIVGNPQWSPVYSWMRSDGSGGTLGLSLGRPVFEDNGDLRGVIDVDLELNALSGFLNGLRIGNTGWAFVTEGDEGYLVATSRPQALVGQDGGRVTADGSADEPTRRIAYQAEMAGNGTGSGVPVGGGGALCIRDEGFEAVWVGGRAVGSEYGLDWHVVVAVPEADLLGEVRAVEQRAIRAGITAALLSLLAGLGVGAAATHPILKLRRHLRGVGEGDLDTPIEMSTGREMTELAGAINGMQEGLKERMRLQSSLLLAEEVQQAFLPGEPPRLARLDIAASSNYADETGGDYYDFLSGEELRRHGDGGVVSRGGVALVLGDVMGHGIASALLMATARGVLRAKAGDVDSLGTLLEHTNVQLVRDTGGVKFMTMMVVALEPDLDRLRWSSAGQGPPMVYDSAADRWVEFDRGGMPLGIEAGAEYSEHVEQELQDGLVVMLSTDGLWEAFNADHEQFGLERVQRVIEANASGTAQEIVDALNGALSDYLGALSADDDVTFVVVKVG
ncbi:MAG: SpoIIE family protein phosphatase [Phycisphaerales bacterium]